MEGSQLLLHGPAVVLRGERTLHEEVEALREGDASRSRGMQDVVLVDQLHFLLDDLDPLLLLFLHLLQPRHHRSQRIREELLDLHLHERSEVLEANRHHVLGRGALGGQGVDVHRGAFLAQHTKRLGRDRPCPVRKRHRKPRERVREVAEAFQPPVDVLGGQVAVVLVKLVSHKDRPPVGGVDLLALPEGGEACSVARLLDAEHDVVLVVHELQHQPVYLGAQLVHGGVLRIRPEPGQVHDAEVGALRALHLYANGHLGDIVAQRFMRLANNLHHLLHGVDLPHL
mmetsp:Transcript_34891/g.104382  ORF Transcript_34891/g.104382 Transcript_34891/m.104382 type:complete len:285 (-) Transcript_34891:376-1230(-)